MHPLERDALVRAIGAAPDPVVLTTVGEDHPDPAFRYVNAAFEALTGYASHEVLGRTPRLLQGAETDRSTTDRLRARLREHQPFHGQTTNYRKDGSPYTVEWRISPVPGPDGTTEAWISVQHDVTARRRAEKAALAAAVSHIAHLHRVLDALRRGSDGGTDLRVSDGAREDTLREAVSLRRPDLVAHRPGGLYAALALLAAEAETAYGVPCAFDFDCFATLDDPAHTRVLLAVARETVRDASGYSPHSVYLALSALQTPVTLSVLVRGRVPDDGPARLQPLVRLARRAGADVAVGPAPAGGYRLVCTLPA